MLSDRGPKHYADKRTSLECLETMILTFGPIQTAFFCLMNAHKYLFRFDLKDNAVDDLNKAIHYTELTSEIVDKYCSVGNDIVSEHIIPKIDTYATMAKQLLKDWNKAHDPVYDTSRAVPCDFEPKIETKHMIDPLTQRTIAVTRPVGRTLDGDVPTQSSMTAAEYIRSKR